MQHFRTQSYGTACKLFTYCKLQLTLAVFMQLSSHYDIY